jgi:hypothetical protein
VTQINGDLLAYTQSVKPVLLGDSSWSFWVYVTNFNPLWANKGMLGSDGFGSNTMTFVLQLDRYVYFYAGNYVGGWNGGSDPSMLPLNTWINYAATLNQTAQTIVVYRNGAQVASYPFVGAISFSSPVKTAWTWQTMNSVWQRTFFNGSIANVQIYNASLGAESIKLIYQKGIGGVPVDLTHLSVWWPLNGDTKDYSGNGNQAIPTNIAYTNQWVKNYPIH